MESEVELDSDYDDIDYDFFYGYWMGYLDDFNKVRLSCEVKDIYLFLLQVLRQVVVNCLLLVRQIIFVMIGLYKVKDNGFVIIMVDCC